NRFYIFLRENGAIRRWLGDAYFSRERLIGRLVQELKGHLPDPATFIDRAQHFTYSPLVYQALQNQITEHKESDGLPPIAWYTAVHLELLESDTPRALVQLEQWLQETLVSSAPIDQRKIELFALHLLIMLLVSVLD